MQTMSQRQYPALIGNGAPCLTKMGTQIIGEYRFSAADNGPVANWQVSNGHLAKAAVAIGC